MPKYLLFIFVTLMGATSFSETVGTYIEAYSAAEKDRASGNDIICDYTGNNASAEEAVKSCVSAGKAENDTKTCLVTELKCHSSSTGWFTINDFTFIATDGASCSSVNPEEAFRSALRVDNPVKFQGN